jgi:hypothetical protein
MANITEGVIRRALKEVQRTRKQQPLVDGEGRGTGRLVLILKPMPTRVTAMWMAQQWRDGRRIKTKLGTYPMMSLSQAREIFDRDYAQLIPDGRSVKIARDTRPGTVSDLFDGYVAHLKSENKPSWSDVEQHLNKAADVIGRSVLAREVTPDDVLTVLRPIYGRGKRSMADHVRSYVRAAFFWALKSEHDYRSSSPRRFNLVSNPVVAIPTERKVVGTALA